MVWDIDIDYMEKNYQENQIWFSNQNKKLYLCTVVFGTNMTAVNINNQSLVLHFGCPN